MKDPALVSYLESFVSKHRLKRFDEVLAHRTKYVTVVMEDLYHLHNTSAVIRSCDVFGIQEVHVIENTFANRLDKKIALGAQKWIDVYRYETTQQCIKELRKKGYTLIATTPQTDATSMEDLAITGKIAFMFGAEKEGLSTVALNEADAFINIPMVGFTESLNVSVAAAILLQYTTAKLRKSKLSWPLTAQEMSDKKLDWTKKSIKDIDKILTRFSSGK
jgi:tRNA (guanosine-2'-O-)-methyltransferase